jgi:cell division septum initiation protein DivIVA
VDILYLLDQLEEVLQSGSRLPFTSRTLVDEQEMLDILDQIRLAIPDEIKAARRLNQDRDQLLDEARSEADRLLRDADAQAAGRVSEHALVRAAESRAAEIESRALTSAERVRAEAETYAYRMLERVRGQIEQVSQTLDRGLRELDSGRAREDAPDEVQRRPEAIRR